MLIIDAHCDAITRIMEESQELNQNTCHIDLQRMLKVGPYAQFFAAYIAPEYSPNHSMKRAIEILDYFFIQSEKNRQFITVCLKASDIQKAIENGKIAAILSIEGGDALEGELSALRMFYRLGVRSIGLTWNHSNEIADGVKDAAAGRGLTPFGREVVQEMNHLGMLIDLSHISEKAFWDVLSLTKAPIIASHSNAKHHCDHIRNLSDEQLLAIKKNRGVIGINFYPNFLNISGKADITDIVRHIEYIASMIGEDYIGIGTDFDGIECTPVDIEGVQHIHRLFDNLARLNYSQEVIEKIAGKNFLRVIKEVVG